RDLLSKVASSQLEHVILAHISETNNHPDRALSVVQAAADPHANQLHIASQHTAGDIISLDGT
ncbi:MAG: hypothetical protein KAT65_00995, partial [Methanophagales archaeon]|nr:hypothetical protein [Methanophagales archaeon]